MTKNIYVTKPFLPDLNEFIPYLEQIWENGILTNNGPFHQEFEDALCEYLDVEHISLFANGTLALVTAIKALGLTGDVITTPYSFVATSHSLLWNNLRPIFVDIEPNGFNLDPDRIEEAITPETTAILAVHCYGKPCQTERIQQIADKHGLKVIYDAAHAFGVKKNNGNLFLDGDLSILSFHATKVFNTFEGGCIISKSAEMKQKLDLLKNFGIENELTVSCTGLNAKMSEFNAAFGLLHLTKLDGLLVRCREIDAHYRAQLQSIAGLNTTPLPANSTGNASYFPILVEDSYPVSRDELYELLKGLGIFARKYFYPLVSDFPMYREYPSSDRAGLPSAAARSAKVLCLPIYPSIDDADINRIIDILKTPKSAASHFK